MYIPSEQEEAELINSSHLVRFTLSNGSAGIEPTLLIKASSLALRYLVRQRRFDMMIARLSNEALFYALRVPDDPLDPLMIWSVMERDDERHAISKVLDKQPCSVHLFNEADVHQASSVITFKLDPPGAILDLDSTILSPEGAWRQHSDEADSLLARINKTGAVGLTEVLAVPEQEVVWSAMEGHLVTNRLSHSLMSLSGIEGDQQEELTVWLTDWLSPEGAVRGPQIQHRGRCRELCDVLLSYRDGWFLVESKNLAVLATENLPDRAKLKRGLLKGITKAVNQLRGAYKRVRAGSRVTTPSGLEVVLPSSRVGHAIVLVPDLSLLSDQPSMGSTLLREFGADSGGCLHILDPGELLRLCQNAEFLSRQSQQTMPMMALDAVLFMRWERGMQLDTADYRYQVRLE